MTREQIEKEAMEYAERIPQSDERREYSREDFIAGAQWRINSVWHKPEEKPEANTRVLVCLETKINKLVYLRIRAFKPHVIKNWNTGNSSMDNVLQWAYLDDLLPERKEEP